MSTSNSVQRAVRLALMTSAAATAVISLPAWSADDTISEVVVTGSRIAQPNLTTTSPVTSVTAADIATQGVTRVEDLINQLPQAFAAQNATVSNGSTGTATVDLRGLGAVRTLVLVDGRRLPYGGVTSASAAPDLNMIPAALVERVEVLTGGASAVYGSDAVSGVVNFIMKKNFEGIQIDGQYSVYQHENDYSGPGAVQLRTTIANRAATNPSQFKLPGESGTDGDGRQGSIIMGVNSEDGRGNITAYAVYSNNNAILQSQRDFSACTLAANPVNNAGTRSFACGGSGTAFPGTFTPDFVTNYTVQGTGAGRIFRPFVTATDQYNFGPLNYFLRPDERYSLGANGHYELSEHADVYTQLMFTDDRSIAQIAPGGAFFDTSTINCDNPLLSAQQFATINCTPALAASGGSVPLYIGRRNVEGGGRQQDFHKNTFRGVLGVKGDIVTGWTYDVSTQFSRVTVDTKTLNYFTKSRLANALDVVTDPATGQPACRSFVNGSDTDCVPYNAFDVNGVTPAALNYLQAPGIQVGIIDQNVTTAAITGDLGTIGFKIPSATEAVQIAFGAEQRRDKLENTTDALQASDQLSGAGGAVIGISGSTLVDDYFAEVSIPIVQDKPGFQQLGLDLAYRYSDYGAVTTDTYKLSGDYAPVSDIRFRASFQRAVRAANIVELFTAQGFNLFDLDGDPCGPSPTASQSACAATGVPAANYGSVALTSPAGQYNFLQGGNTALKPEESDTYSYGFVFTPGFVPGLSVTVDYYDIKINDTVASFGAENTLVACYENNDQAACARILRNDAGQLWVGDGNVVDLNTNIGSLQTKGVDVAVAYSGLDIGAAGSLSFNLTGTYLDELVINPGGGLPAYDCKGFFAGQCTSGAVSGVPSPAWRHMARIGWTTPFNVDLSLSWRYFGAVDQFGAAANRIDRHFSHENYFDLYGAWAMTDMATVRLGINNVLDNDPQLSASVGTTGNGNTFPQTYDALGRYIFTGLTVKF
jgi:outer membrane receptor protein involved in Fe transport